jgi:hypothetical protein
MRERRIGDDALERALFAMGPGLAYPATPPLAAAVTARLESDRAAPGRPRARLALHRRRRVLVLVAIGLLAALGIAFGARFVLGSAEIRIRPGATPSGPPLVPGELGVPVPVEEVAEAVGFEVRIPAGPAPDEAHVVETRDGRRAALLAWRAGHRHPPLPGTPWGLVLLETSESADVTVKDVDRFEDLREVRVHGRPAFWIHAPHELVVRTAEGPRAFAVRGNVLIWTRGPITFRMETGLPLREAIGLAETVG